MSSPSDPPAPRPVPSGSGLVSGATVGGDRYLLKKVLGQGGMGVVWLAHDKRLREPVALKFLPTQISFDPAALDNLRRETLRSRKLSHSNIVRIHDLYEAANELAFISMEYVDGPNLHYLRAHRPAQVLPWKFLAPLVRQLCAALDYAHGERVIHRDLKPANLMLDSNERLKMADFGLACVVHDSLSRIPGYTSGGGTLDFMSPQQADGKKPEITDDIYSLGATLYELLTSRPPFYTGDVAYQLRNTRPQPMNERLLDLELSNEIPSDVAALVMACLAKDPEQRPQSAKAILDWLDAAESPNKASGVTPPQETGRPPSPPSPPSAIHQTSHPAGESQTAPAVPLPTGGGAPPAAHGVRTQREQLPDPDPSPPQSDASFTEGRSQILIPSKKRLVRWILGGSAGLLALLGIVGVFSARSPSSAPGDPQSNQDLIPVEPASEEFEVLFNGRDLTGWEGDANIWFVKDGIITGDVINRSVSGRKGPHLFWKGQADDFELRLSFLLERGNSGVFYRGKQFEDGNAAGYQFEIWKDNIGGLTDTGPERSRRDFVRAEEFQRYVKKNDWNDVVITAQGSRLAHVLNGSVIATVVDTNENRRISSGLFALEMFGPTIVHFKDVRLKRLRSDTVAASTDSQRDKAF